MNRGAKTAAVIVAAMLILTVGGLGAFRFIKSALLPLTQPLIKTANSGTLSVRKFFYTLKTIKEQLSLTEQLQLEKRRLLSENTRLRQAEIENEELRKMLGLRQQADLNMVAASLVSFDPTGVVKNVTIDKGSNSGISPGDAVLDEAGNLLGVIFEVFPESSSYRSITDGLVKVDAEVVDRDALGIITGSHGLGLNLEFIPQDVALEKDDLVVTSGLTGQIPSGILIGFIDKPISSNSELFQRFSVIPAANNKFSRFVFVVTGF